jgi:hypothetical protein
MKSIIFRDITPCGPLSCTRSSTETSGATQRTTRRHIPEEYTLFIELFGIYIIPILCCLRYVWWMRRFGYSYTSETSYIYIYHVIHTVNIVQRDISVMSYRIRFALLGVFFWPIPCLAYSSTMKMDVVRSSETLGKFCLNSQKITPFKCNQIHSTTLILLPKTLIMLLTAVD